jgi:hypothetical protein
MMRFMRSLTRGSDCDVDLLCPDEEIRKPILGLLIPQPSNTYIGNAGDSLTETR